MTDQPQTIVLPALVDETNVLFDVPLHTIVPSRWQPRQSFDPEALLDHDVELCRNFIHQIKPLPPLSLPGRGAGGEGPTKGQNP